MKRFLSKVFVFAIPLMFYVMGVVLVDPFDRFEVSRLIPDTSKQPVALVFNNALWKVIAFRHRPGANVILGSSKMGLLKPQLIKDITGLDYRDLSIGGASANEIINLFWYAAGRVKLEAVCMGVSIENFNRNNNRDRVTGAVTTADSTLLYLSNRDVAEASWNLVSATFFGGQLASAVPLMNKDAFWKVQLGESSTRNFYRFELDEASLRRLGEVAAYCQQHAIDFKLVIMPNHADVHERLRAFGVDGAWKVLSRRLAALAPTYDFDVDSELTRDREHFNDPFHFDHETAEMIVRKVWAVPPR